ncbi:MAG: UDP-N-acetylmuramate dehydrogenase [Candidatus Sungbacteria bacterium]|nr:UDP-N-acetylmuramate dehydrogenase [Candidatus Sungbacteria bacterium]
MHTMIVIQENIILAPYTIYKIGGPARFFVETKQVQEVQEALEFAAEKNKPFFILGAGSNVLISDKGFDGLVIRMTGGEIAVEGERIKIDAGVMMARAVMESGRAALTGFEWGIGVPGTIGGSVRGNAGCFGGEMKDVIESVEMFDTDQKIIRIMNNSECEFGYRDSVFKKHPDLVVLAATLHVKTGDQEKIQQEIRRIMQERVAKQDIGAKCCGCIFKNVSWMGQGIDKQSLLAQFPELHQFENAPHIPAAFFVDMAGLKGQCRGKVCISQRHANFFINQGGGLSDDVRALIGLAKEEVRKKFGILLEEEIQMIGF